MARNFDETDDYLEVTADAAVNGLTTYSIGCWVTRESGGESGYGRLAQKGPNTAPNRYWRIENDNEGAGWGMIFVAEWSSAQGAWSIAYPDTAWHHHLITYDATSTANNPLWYLDGASQSVTERITPSGTLATDNNEFNIGSSTTRSLTWDGSIAEFAIWNRILTPGEAKGLGAGFSPVYYPNGLVFYCPIFGNNSPEPELMKGTGAVVLGAAKVAHPRIIYPAAKELRRFFATQAQPPAVAAITGWRNLLGVGF